MVAPGLLNVAVVQCGLVASVQIFELFGLINSLLGGIFFILAIQGRGFDLFFNCTSRVWQGMTNTPHSVVRVYFELCVKSSEQVT